MSFGDGILLYDNRADEREKGRYWNEFYARSGGKIAPPSQFAAFVLQEANDLELIIEVGSGSGRDSFFFARHGMNVAAIDGSEIAILNCDQARTNAGLTNVSFHCASVGSSAFSKIVKSIRQSGSPETALVYARFFLHALTDDEEDNFFAGLAGALEIGDLVALEYRTVRDASGAKVTPSHYRRFVEPSHVFAKARSHGFGVQYAVEGYGFAKYGPDDAYVARCILKMVGND